MTSLFFNLDRYRSVGEKKVQDLLQSLREYSASKQEGVKITKGLKAIENSWESPDSMMGKSKKRFDEMMSKLDEAQTEPDFEEVDALISNYEKEFKGPVAALFTKEGEDRSVGEQKVQTLLQHLSERSELGKMGIKASEARNAIMDPWNGVDLALDEQTTKSKEQFDKIMSKLDEAKTEPDFEEVDALISNYEKEFKGPVVALLTKEGEDRSVGDQKVQALLQDLRQRSNLGKREAQISEELKIVRGSWEAPGTVLAKVKGDYDDIIRRLSEAQGESDLKEAGDLISAFEQECQGTGRAFFAKEGEDSSAGEERVQALLKDLRGRLNLRTVEIKMQEESNRAKESWGAADSVLVEAGEKFNEIMDKLNGAENDSDYTEVSFLVSRFEKKFQGPCAALLTREGENNDARNEQVKALFHHLKRCFESGKIAASRDPVAAARLPKESVQTSLKLVFTHLDFVDGDDLDLLARVFDDKNHSESPLNPKEEVRLNELIKEKKKGLLGRAAKPISFPLTAEESERVAKKLLSLLKEKLQEQHEPLPSELDPQGVIRRADGAKLQALKVRLLGADSKENTQGLDMKVTEDSVVRADQGKMSEVCGGVPSHTDFQLSSGEAISRQAKLESLNIQGPINDGNISTLSKSLRNPEVSPQRKRVLLQQFAAGLIEYGLDENCSESELIEIRKDIQKMGLYDTDPIHSEQRQVIFMALYFEVNRRDPSCTELGLPFIRQALLSMKGDSMRRSFLSKMDSSVAGSKEQDKEFEDFLRNNPPGVKNDLLRDALAADAQRKDPSLMGSVIDRVDTSRKFELVYEEGKTTDERKSEDQFTQITLDMKCQEKSVGKTVMVYSKTGEMALQARKREFIPSSCGEMSSHQVAKLLTMGVSRKALEAAKKAGLPDEILDLIYGMGGSEQQLESMLSYLNREGFDPDTLYNSEMMDAFEERIFQDSFLEGLFDRDPDRANAFLEKFYELAEIYRKKVSSGAETLDSKDVNLHLYFSRITKQIGRRLNPKNAEMLAKVKAEIEEDLITSSDLERYHFKIAKEKLSRELDKIHGKIKEHVRSSWSYRSCTSVEWSSLDANPIEEMHFDPNKSFQEQMEEMRETVSTHFDKLRKENLGNKYFRAINPEKPVQNFGDLFSSDASLNKKLASNYLSSSKSELTGIEELKPENLEKKTKDTSSLRKLEQVFETSKMAVQYEVLASSGEGRDIEQEGIIRYQSTVQTLWDDVQDIGDKPSHEQLLELLTKLNKLDEIREERGEKIPRYYQRLHEEVLDTLKGHERVFQKVVNEQVMKDPALLARLIRPITDSFQGSEAEEVISVGSVEFPKKEYLIQKGDWDYLGQGLYECCIEGRDESYQVNILTGECHCKGRKISVVDSRVYESEVYKEWSGGRVIELNTTKSRSDEKELEGLKARIGQLSQKKEALNAQIADFRSKNKDTSKLEEDLKKTSLDLSSAEDRKRQLDSTKYYTSRDGEYVLKLEPKLGASPDDKMDLHIYRFKKGEDGKQLKDKKGDVEYKFMTNEQCLSIMDVPKGLSPDKQEKAEQNAEKNRALLTGLLGRGNLKAWARERKSRIPGRKLSPEIVLTDAFGNGHYTIVNGQIFKGEFQEEVLDDKGKQKLFSYTDFEGNDDFTANLEGFLSSPGKVTEHVEVWERKQRKKWSLFTGKVMELCINSKVDASAGKSGDGRDFDSIGLQQEKPGGRWHYSKEPDYQLVVQGEQSESSLENFLKEHRFQANGILFFQHSQDVNKKMFILNHSGKNYEFTVDQNGQVSALSREGRFVLAEHYVKEGDFSKALSLLEAPWSDGKGMMSEKEEKLIKTLLGEPSREESKVESVKRKRFQAIVGSQLYRFQLASSEGESPDPKVLLKRVKSLSDAVKEVQGDESSIILEEGFFKGVKELVPLVSRCCAGLADCGKDLEEIQSVLTKTQKSVLNQSSKEERSLSQEERAHVERMKSPDALSFLLGGGVDREDYLEGRSDNYTIDGLTADERRDVLTIYNTPEKRKGLPEAMKKEMDRLLPAWNSSPNASTEFKEKVNDLIYSLANQSKSDLKLKGSTVPKLKEEVQKTRRDLEKVIQSQYGLLTKYAGQIEMATKIKTSPEQLVLMLLKERPEIEHCTTVPLGEIQQAALMYLHAKTEMNQQNKIAEELSKKKPNLEKLAGLLSNKRPYDFEEIMKPEAKGGSSRKRLDALAMLFQEYNAGYRLREDQQRYLSGMLNASAFQRDIGRGLEKDLKKAESSSGRIEALKRCLTSLGGQADDRESDEMLLMEKVQKQWLIKNNEAPDSFIQLAQMPTGFGKTAVFFTTLALRNADGNTLVKLTSPGALRAQNKFELNQEFQEAYDTFVSDFEFDSGVPFFRLESYLLEKKDQLENAIENGTMIITSPDSCDRPFRALMRKLIDEGRENTNAFRLMEEILEIFQDKGFEIVDEADKIVGSIHEDFRLVGGKSKGINPDETRILNEFYEVGLSDFIEIMKNPNGISLEKEYHNEGGLKLKFLKSLQEEPRVLFQITKKVRQLGSNDRSVVNEHLLNLYLLSRSQEEFEQGSGGVRLEDFKKNLKRLFPEEFGQVAFANKCLNKYFPHFLSNTNRLGREFNVDDGIGKPSKGGIPVEGSEFEDLDIRAVNTLSAYVQRGVFDPLSRTDNRENFIDFLVDSSDSEIQKILRSPEIPKEGQTWESFVTGPSAKAVAKLVDRVQAEKRKEKNTTFIKEKIKKELQQEKEKLEEDANFQGALINEFKLMDQDIGLRLRIVKSMILDKRLSSLSKTYMSDCYDSLASAKSRLFFSATYQLHNLPQPVRELRCALQPELVLKRQGEIADRREVMVEPLKESKDPRETAFTYFKEDLKKASKDPHCQLMVDGAGLWAGLDNQDLAVEALKTLKKHIVYFDTKQNQLMILRYKTKKGEVIVGDPEAYTKEKMQAEMAGRKSKPQDFFIVLDKGRSTGTDTKDVQYEGHSMVVTTGPGMTYDDFLQARGRSRMANSNWAVSCSSKFAAEISGKEGAISTEAVLAHIQDYSEGRKNADDFLSLQNETQQILKDEAEKALSRLPARFNEEQKKVIEKAKKVIEDGIEGMEPNDYTTLRAIFENPLAREIRYSKVRDCLQKVANHENPDVAKAIAIIAPSVASSVKKKEDWISEMKGHLGSMDSAVGHLEKALAKEEQEISSEETEEETIEARVKRAEIQAKKKEIHTRVEKAQRLREGLGLVNRFISKVQTEGRFPLSFEEMKERFSQDLIDLRLVKPDLSDRDDLKKEDLWEALNLNRERELIGELIPESGAIFPSLKQRIDDLKLFILFDPPEPPPVSKELRDRLGTEGGASDDLGDYFDLPQTLNGDERLKWLDDRFKQCMTDLAAIQNVVMMRQKNVEKPSHEMIRKAQDSEAGQRLLRLFERKKKSIQGPITVGSRPLDASSHATSESTSAAQSVAASTTTSTTESQQQAQMLRVAASSEVQNQATCSKTKEEFHARDIGREALDRIREKGFAALEELCTPALKHDNMYTKNDLGELKLNGGVGADVRISGSESGKSSKDVKNDARRALVEKRLLPSQVDAALRKIPDRGYEIVYLELRIVKDSSKLDEQVIRRFEERSYYGSLKISEEARKILSVESSYEVTCPGCTGCSKCMGDCAKAYNYGMPLIQSRSVFEGYMPDLKVIQANGYSYAVTKEEYAALREHALKGMRETLVDDSDIFDQGKK